MRRVILGQKNDQVRETGGMCVAEYRSSVHLANTPTQTQSSAKESSNTDLALASSLPVSSSTPCRSKEVSDVDADVVQELKKTNQYKGSVKEKTIPNDIKVIAFNMTLCVSKLHKVVLIFQQVSAV